MSVLSMLDKATLERYRSWLRRIKSHWPPELLTDRELDKILESYGRATLDEAEKRYISAENRKVITLSDVSKKG